MKMREKKGAGRMRMKFVLLRDGVWTVHKNMLSSKTVSQNKCRLRAKMWSNLWIPVHAPNKIFWIICVSWLFMHLLPFISLDNQESTVFKLNMPIICGMCQK
jgi:hypothetical protein